MKKLMADKLFFLLVTRVAPVVLAALGTWVATKYHEGYQAFCGV